MEAYRRELLAHCYRLMGSVEDAEDLVQETYLRAWRAREGFEGRASQRTYLYRIATNACLTALRRRPAGTSWQPLPDGRWEDPTDTRAVVRLAFVAALQHLSPIRRAVLILRDVLDWPAVEVAEALGTTTAAVNSALVRARARLARVAPEVHEVAEAGSSGLIDAYVEAFHDADIGKLVSLFREDIAFEMPPGLVRVDGREAVGEFFGANVLTRPGEFRMARTAANGQPAFVAFRDGAPHALHVLTIRDDRIVGISVFHGERVLRLFKI